MHKLEKVHAINQLTLVEHHAKNLEACASAMEADAIGGDITHGHVAVLRRMAANLRANAAHGKLPSVFHDQLHAAAEPRKLDAATTAILNALR